MTQSGPGGRSSAVIWGALGAVVAVVLAVSLWSVASVRPSPAGSGAAAAPTVLEVTGDHGPVPAFSLTDATGRVVTLDDLAGKWWIADFIFTRCAGICPLLSSRMVRLAASIPDLDRGDVRFVSFTVDPDHDTPETLARYASGLPIPPQAAGRWLFLTGPRDRIQQLVMGGFRLNMIERDAASPPEADLVTHSERFVLVDPRGRIRGYYHGTDDASVQRLAADLETLRAGESAR